MQGLESRLDPEAFLRIHRSTIVNLDRVRDLKPLFHGGYLVTLKDGTELTSSRNYSDRLRGLFGPG
jgi:two-component system LytT family response regulator